VTAKCVLTIGIPTWNRARSLERMMRSVTDQAERLGCARAVEIVVSDNASSDDTFAVVQKIKSSSAVAVRYHRNAENIGTVRNIFKTVELAAGDFWMFYGDDDLVVDGALPTIIALMEQNADVTAFLFHNVTIVCDGSRLLPEFARLTLVEAARSYFHYMGNAGVFALRTDAARAALQRWGATMHTWWPQTQLLFAAAAQSDSRSPLAAAAIDATLSPNHERNVVYTSWYIWETMLHSLYVAARELKPIVGAAVYHAACKHLFERRRLASLAGSLMLHSTFFDRPDERARTRHETWRALTDADTHAFVPFLLMASLASLPHWLSLPVFWMGVFVRWPFQLRSRIRWIREKRAKYSEKRNTAGTGEARLYTPADL
jgi:glycosyltransferase involved in cell wall biosynthesis